MKITLSSYGDTLDNEGARPEDLLTGWIGNHSCGSANIGKLNISNFSKGFNIIVCSHCKTTYKIPKNVETFNDLQNHPKE